MYLKSPVLQLLFVWSLSLLKVQLIINITHPINHFKFLLAKEKRADIFKNSFLFLAAHQLLPIQIYPILKIQPFLLTNGSLISFTYMVFIYSFITITGSTNHFKFFLAKERRLIMGVHRGREGGEGGQESAVPVLNLWK